MLDKYGLLTASGYEGGRSGLNEGGPAFADGRITCSASVLARVSERSIVALSMAGEVRCDQI